MEQQKQVEPPKEDSSSSPLDWLIPLFDEINADFRKEPINDVVLATDDKQAQLNEKMILGEEDDDVTERNLVIDEAGDNELSLIKKEKEETEKMEGSNIMENTEQRKPLDGLSVEHIDGIMKNI